MKKPQTPSEEVQRSVLIVGAATVFLVLVVFSLAVVGWVALDREVSRNGKSVTALCALRGDLKDRARAEREQAKRSLRFLREHPHGIPGIPPTLIKAGIEANQKALAGQERTIASLSILDCKEKP